jgi:NAD(P)-dependent dehydrogenase (short-subunit alcohol dehydrogenase family)
VITGGTSGIGARTAELFAREGATTVIAGRRAEEEEAQAAKLGRRPSSCAPTCRSKRTWRR